MTETILARRQKDVDYGRNTDGYRNYIALVPKCVCVCVGRGYVGCGVRILMVIKLCMLHFVECCSDQENALLAAYFHTVRIKCKRLLWRLFSHNLWLWRVWTLTVCALLFEFNSKMNSLNISSVCVPPPIRPRPVKHVFSGQFPVQCYTQLRSLKLSFSRQSWMTVTKLTHPFLLCFSFFSLTGPILFF